MKHNTGIKHFRIAAVACAAALAAAGAAYAGDDAPAPPAYLVFDTGPAGGSYAFGSGITNSGWVSGLITTPGGAQHAALYVPGNVIDLGTLGGVNSAVEWPVKNNHGMVVGIAETGTPDPNGEVFSCAGFIPGTGTTCLPFIWQQTTGMVALPLLGGNNGFATEVNNSGVAVGWAETAVHDPTCIAPQVLQFLAVEWGPAAGQKQVLPPLPGDSTSAATAINDFGRVVGISGECGDAGGAFSARHALLWVNGHPIKLPTLGGQGWNTPMAINRQGTVAGFSDTPGDVVDGVLSANFQAALWPADGGIVNLHTLPGDALAEATGINDRGQIAGTSFAASGAARAFLWQNGQIYDLNTLVPANSGLYMISTGDINDHGDITGQACVVASGCTELHTFVAIPAPGTAAAAAPYESRSEDVSMSVADPRVLRQHLHLGSAGAARIGSN
jgi:probable HAF family extracellular repeat protein